jgi:uncharacterized SAM-binding protein YcdF (DUF218 family)
MTLFLSKLVPVVLYPLGLAILLALVALVFRRFRRIAGTALLLSILVLWAASMPVTANLLSLRWEAAYPPVAIADLPKADAIVLLGGFAAQPLPPRTAPDLNAHGDRLFEAARLFHAGKASHIVISAGNLPWDTVVAPEAQWAGALLSELGVPADAIVLESASRNTYENATFTKPILAQKRWRKVLLVTSATHMLRAMATFRKAGIAATAATTDVDGTDPVFTSVLDFLPAADALSTTTDVIKEMIGMVYYRLRGWA